MSMFKVALNQLDLRLLPLCRPRQACVEKMVTALGKQGQLTPIIVSDKVLVDGFKRYEAAQRLNLEQLTAVAIEADPVRSKALTLMLNQGKHGSIIQEALLVRELVEVDGMSQSETALMLGRHKSWVHRRLLFIKSLAPQIIEDIQFGFLPAGSGLHLARLHTCNQGDLSAVIQNHKLKTQEIRTLVDLLAKAKAPEVKKILHDSPRQVLELYRGERKMQDMLDAIWSMLQALEKKLQPNEKVHASLSALKANLQSLEQDLKEVI